MRVRSKQCEEAESEADEISDAELPSTEDGIKS